MIDRLIGKYMKDFDYRYDRIIKRETEEEDLILILRDLSAIIEILQKISEDISTKCGKYISKN
jgi:hypothetical protein